LIPEADVDISTKLPLETTFWVPEEDEVSEDEGIGFFRDVRLIYNCSVDEARQIIADEARLIDLVDQLSSDRVEFEEFAGGVEHPNPEADGLSDELKARISAEVFDEVFREEISPTDWLELGVAGLTFALSAAGLLTAASCRSHVEHSWSPYPVVLFVSDRRHMDKLIHLVKQSNCGISNDGRFFYIYARNIRDTSGLARLIVDHCGESFGPPVFEWGRSANEGQPFADPNQMELPGISDP
jgi:hypothetical protein